MALIDLQMWNPPVVPGQTLLAHDLLFSLDFAMSNLQTFSNEECCLHTSSNIILVSFIQYWLAKVSLEGIM